MRKLLFIIAILLSFGVHAQTFMPIHNYQAPDGVDVVKFFGIPHGETPTLNGVNRPNAHPLYYKTTDSSLYLYTGTQWIIVGGTCDTCISTVNISADSTLMYFIRVNGDTARVVDFYGGSSGSYQLPYNGNATDYLGGDTAYHPLPITDTSHLSDRIDLKLNISDTAAMLAPYHEGGSTIDTANKWLSDVDSVAQNTLRFYKGSGYKDFVFTGVDTSHLSDRINQKFNISDTAAKWVSWGFKRNDSVFLCKNTTCTFIFKDSSGGGGSTYTPTDTAFKLIRAQGLYSSYNPNKGIRLENPTIDGTTQQNAPPLVFKASQNGNPYWYKIAAEAWALKLQYSSDSINYSNGITIDRLGGLSGSYTASFNQYVSAPQFAGTKMSLLSSFGYGVFGANRQPNPLAQLELTDSTRGTLINRVSNLQKKKITTSVYAGTITNGGSGYGSNGAVDANFTGGSGTGQGGHFTVSGGAITGLILSTQTGINYKVGDVLSTSFNGGSGLAFTVTKLAGDTANGLMVVDTTLNCLSTYNKTQQRWDNMPTSNTYTASGDGTSTTITVPHGLNNVTSSSLVWVNAKNAASANIGYVTIDATNVYVHYTTAPASGTNNLLYDIQIKKE